MASKESRSRSTADLKIPVEPLPAPNTGFTCCFFCRHSVSFEMSRPSCEVAATRTRVGKHCDVVVLTWLSVTVKQHR